MKERIPWARVLTEGAVIIVSILLALAADAWWQGRQDREEEQEALQGLEEDFAANLAQLEGTLAFTQWSRTLVEQLYTLSDTELAAVPSDSADLYAGALTITTSFNSRDGTLDALIASGRLGMISNTRLRASLVEWKSGVADLLEDADNLRDVSQRVTERSAQLGGPWRFDVGGMQLPASLVEVTNRYPPADLAVAMRDTEFSNLTRWKQFTQTVYRLQLEPLAEQAENILALVAND